MATFKCEYKSVIGLFSDSNSKFLIPDYQRPYSWGEEECETLWEDTLEFAFPGGNPEAFQKKQEYFLGPIVIFQNKEEMLEVIDGQQRLTTLLLLLRAFYSRLEKQAGDRPKETRKDLAKCIWETTEYGEILSKDFLRITSEVATDDDKGEFLEILKNGTTSNEQKSRYAEIFRFFAKKIDDFWETYALYATDFPMRIMKFCILLPIETETQDAAFRIFTTLNDRGKPLSDSDIFKAKFYKFYSDQGRKIEFIERWKKLEEKCSQIFSSSTGTPLDELFTRYMYYERAKRGIKQNMTEALRKFYEKATIEADTDKTPYALLRQEETLCNLEQLAQFWENVYKQSLEVFSEEILKRLFVLEHAPNSMWTYLVSIYFMVNRDRNNQLDEAMFVAFLEKITAFIWGYSFIKPGVNQLRTPVYPEMIRIVNHEDIKFQNALPNRAELQTIIETFVFTNGRPITKSMLAWWAFQEPNQKYLPLETRFDTEHIFAKKRAESHPLKNKKNMEALGNKSLLESRININATCYAFSDKKKYYCGEIKNQKGTEIQELKTLASQKEDFTEADIENRTNQIIQAFLDCLEGFGLLKND